MTNKYQKLAKLQKITVSTFTNETVDILYSELELIFINNQLYWLYKSKDGNLIVPIAKIIKKQEKSKMTIYKITMSGQCWGSGEVEAKNEAEAEIKARNNKFITGFKWDNDMPIFDEVVEIEKIGE